MEIEPSKEKEFLKMMTVPVKKIGKVGGRWLKIISDREVVTITVNDMRNAWSGALGKLMG
jgi:hypothetical protein